MILFLLLGDLYFLTNRLGGENSLAEVEYNALAILTADAVGDLTLPVKSLRQSFIVSKGNLALVKLDKIAINRLEIL